jgi:hypothetical protein
VEAVRGAPPDATWFVEVRDLRRERVGELPPREFDVEARADAAVAAPADVPDELAVVRVPLEVEDERVRLARRDVDRRGHLDDRHERTQGRR